jgi:P27 family predicted phage terminase small subunit
MAIRGRRPKPTRRQISEGDPAKRGKRKLQEKLNSEPKATRGLPPCPKHVVGVARSAWKFWVEELRAMKLDARADAMMLEGACVNYARAVQADAIIQRGCQVEEPIINHTIGKVIGTKIKNHPAVAISNAAWRQVRAFCSEFGLSPVSRTRLALEQPDTSIEDLMKLLATPREKRKKNETIQ